MKINVKFPKLIHFLLGFVIVIFLVSLVSGVRFWRGSPTVIEFEEKKIRGPIDAKIFIVEFSDFRCGYCKQIQPMLKDLLNTYPEDLKLVFKHYPLSLIYSNAGKAAEATECAADQGEFWVYHDILFEKFDDWRRSKSVENDFVRYATSLNLDTEAFEICLRSGIKKEIVIKNKKEGQKCFVSGTPTLLLNGTKVLMHSKPENVKKVIQKEMEKIKK